MKVRYIYIALVALLGGIFWGCSDWTEVESKDFFTPPSDSYYEALREYKKSDHEISFGWFGNWTGVGASLVNSMRGIPDSVDLVSIWGNWKNITPDQDADLRFCQKVKGTKFLLCFIVHNLGDQLTPEGQTIQEYWGWEGELIPDRPYQRWEMIDTEVTPAQETIIRKYAKQIIDTIAKYNYDGFDIDYEPNYQGKWGSLANYPKRMSIFIEELSKYLGPKSGGEKILVIDGEPQSMPSERGECMNYFIVQAYQCSGDADLDSRLKSTINNFDGYLSPQEVAKKYIVTENFESYVKSAKRKNRFSKTKMESQVGESPKRKRPVSRHTHKNKTAFERLSNGIQTLFFYAKKDSKKHCQFSRILYLYTVLERVLPLHFLA